MSAVYSSEPVTSGKVLLETTKGSIEIELFAKETPLASRNFIQLCMEGYFNNTIFHRVIKGFMVQGGDPTGTGSGGQSIYTDGIAGKYFRDEFHSRISFNRRGLVACANQSKANTNGSQFFITLAACKHLDKKHTIFGRIVGPTIFNVLQIENLEIGEDDRPVYPPKIVSTKIITNPFDDIKIRKNTSAQQDSMTNNNPNKKKRKRKRIKNLGLLSFGEDEEELNACDDNFSGSSNHTGIKTSGIISLHDSIRSSMNSDISELKQKSKKNKKKKKKRKKDAEDQTPEKSKRTVVNKNSRENHYRIEAIGNNDINATKNEKTGVDIYENDDKDDAILDNVSNANGNTEKCNAINTAITSYEPNTTGDKRESWVEDQMNAFNNNTISMDDW
jgi:peptidyl-prolyl cis-trans isomerase SDCCAG10